MRIPSLDGLRAISIALVVWCHVGDGRGMYSYGSFGVTIFFVISGFLITHLLAAEEEKRGSVSISDFYRRRAFRILPPAILYLLVTAGLTSGVDVLHCLLFVRNLNPGSEVTSHYWSLSIEEQFYLIWPAAFVLLASNCGRLF